MNEFKLNKTCSSLKEPNPTLSNEQSAMKVKEEKKEVIKRIEEVIESGELDTDDRIYSLTMTGDKRIAIWTRGCIFILSYDVNEKGWKRDIFKKEPLNAYAYSLCSLNVNRLLSGVEGSIKVWFLFDADLRLIKEIEAHIVPLRKIIPLSNKRFASCSMDNTVKIWKDKAYRCLSTLRHDNWVNSILQLRGKEVLIASYFGHRSSGISFWNINNYTKQHTITGYGVHWSTNMIELSNGNIALSPYDESSIVIIDSSSYQIVTMIQLKEYITHDSSLCVFDEHSFIYVCEGTFLQISNEDGRVLFHSKGGGFNGFFGIIPLEGGKYFAIENDAKISIIKLCFA